MNDQLYMAPIMAFTDCTYREVYFRHFSGFDRAIAPFIVVSENSHYKTKSIQSLLPILHNTIPVEPQVLSKDPYAFAALCILLEEMGFPSVNINMGCPATAVVNKGRGSALLPHPDQIREFLDISFSKIKMPISIKLRSGFYSHNEIYPIIDILNAYPFSEVIIHPRLGVNKYEGPVDLDVVDDLIALLRIPIVYNGDISRDTFYSLKKRFRKISRWMIGRELLRDPFLAGDIQASFNSSFNVLPGIKAIDEKRKIKIREFHDDLLIAFLKTIKSEEALVGKMKSYWYYMESLFPDKKNEVQNLKKILKLDEYRTCIENIFKE